MPCTRDSVIKGRKAKNLSNMLLYFLLCLASTTNAAIPSAAPLPRLWPPWHMNETDGVQSEDEWLQVEYNARRYVEWEFALSTIGGGERGRTTVVPVYFWPMEQLVLDCQVNDNKVFSNGMPKQWSVVPYWNWTYALGDGEEQFLFGKYALRDPVWISVAQFESGKASGVRGMSVDRQQPMPLPHSTEKEGTIDGQPPRPRFYQRRGQLVIMHASPNVQGVYTCADPTMHRVATAYVLMARMPLVRGETLVRPQTAKPRDDDQGSTMASWYWQFTSIPFYVPTKREKGCPTYSEVEGVDYEGGAAQCNHYFRPATKFTAKRKSSGWLIYVKWGKWSKCNSCNRRPGTTTKEGHCHVRAQGSSSFGGDDCPSKTSAAIDRVLKNEEIFDGSTEVSSGLLVWMAFEANGGRLDFDASGVGVNHFPNNDALKECGGRSAPALLYDLFYSDSSETSGCFGSPSEDDGAHSTVGYVFKHAACQGEETCT